MRNDLLEICRRLEGYGEKNTFSVTSATKNGSEWTLLVAGEKDCLMVYEIAQRLNGYNKSDYFAIKKVEEMADGHFEVVCTRVSLDEEENQENEEE